MYKIIHTTSGEVCFVPNIEYRGFSTVAKAQFTMNAFCNNARCLHLTCDTCPWNGDNNDSDDPYFNFTLADYKAAFEIRRIRYQDYIKDFDGAI